MAITDIMRRRLRTPGFAGGSLEEQLLRDGIPTSDVNAPTRGGVALGQGVNPITGTMPQSEREVVTRPRTVGVPPEQAADPNATRQRAVTFNPATGRPNEDFYRDKGDTQGLYDAYTNWQPRGGKRGFKNALKAGALTAAAAAQSTDDPRAIIAAFGIGAGAGGVNPNFKNQLVKRFRQQQVGAELGQELDFAKQRSQAEMGQMVPVQLDNGEIVQVPQRTAGSLRSQQQRIGQQQGVLTDRKRTTDARIQRWENMDKRDRMRNLISLYNSGGLNDPQMLEYAADQLGLPGPLREKFIQGQLRDALAEDGTLIQVNRQTGTATPVTQATPQPAGSRGRTVMAPVRGFQATQEQGRNTRAANAQAGQNQRAAARQANGTRGTSADRIAQRRAAQLSGKIEEVRKELERFDSRQLGGVALTPELARGRKAIADKAASAIAEINTLGAGYEAGEGTGGYPYFKQREGASDLDQPIVGKSTTQGGQYAGKRISKANVAEYGRRHGMSAEDAAAFLTKEGATIY